MASAPTSLAPLDAPPAHSFIKRLHGGDAVAYTITLIAASSIFLVTVLLVYYLWSESALPRHKFGWSFIFTRVWDPVAGQFGALPFAFGTTVTALLALIISVPIGLGAAIFLAELA